MGRLCSIDPMIGSALAIQLLQKIYGQTALRPVASGTCVGVWHSLLLLNFHCHILHLLFISFHTFGFLASLQFARILTNHTDRMRVNHWLFNKGCGPRNCLYLRGIKPWTLEGAYLQNQVL